MGKFVISQAKNGVKFNLKAANGEVIASSQVYKDKAGEFRFRLKATNGQIIATGEGYKAMAGCKRGIESIKKNVVDAKIIVEAPKEEKAE